MILKVTGSPELLAKVKTDSKDGKFIWSVAPGKPFDQQISKLENLKTSFHIHASGAGIEGILQLTKYPERVPINMGMSPERNGLKTYDTMYVVFVLLFMITNFHFLLNDFIFTLSRFHVSPFPF